MSHSRRSPGLPFVCAALLFLLAAAPALSLASDEDIFDTPQTGTGKKAALTIFYNGETTGELHPCPT